MGENPEKEKKKKLLAIEESEFVQYCRSIEAEEKLGKEETIASTESKAVEKDLKS